MEPSLISMTVPEATQSLVPPSPFSVPLAHMYWRPVSEQSRVIQRIISPTASLLAELLQAISQVPPQKKPTGGAQTAQSP